jgi:hypothetical protein
MDRKEVIPDGYLLSDDPKVTERRLLVADMYLKGRTQRYIAEKTGVSQVMIHKDLKIIRRLWKESAIKDYDEKVAIECQKLDAIERAAWEGWRRSKRDEETVEESMVLGTPRRTVKRRGQAGSAHFLSVAMRCVEARCNLLGLNKKEEEDPEKNRVQMVVQLQQIIENHGSYIELRRQQVLAGGGIVPGVSGDVHEQRELEACKTLDVTGLDPGASGDEASVVAGAEVDSSDHWSEGSVQADQSVNDRRAAATREK